jgi:bifunctional DNA-binding transcriptional regulator/antitoxin component of YhaV-PrlF toxin-antitoxin module
MKLQKQLSRRGENKDYSKYVLVVPPDEIEKLGWKEGQELEHEVREQSLIVKPMKKTKSTD